MADTAKPGIKTTEFWLTLLAAITSAVVASGMLGEGSIGLQAVGLLGAVLAALGYGTGRAKVKVAAPATPATPAAPAPATLIAGEDIA